MKSFYLTLLTLIIFTGFANAQELTGKIPEEAAMVIRYAGGNMSQKMTAEKFDTYALLKKKFFNAFKTDGKTSLQGTGINMEADAYQYLTTTDSTTGFVTLVSISNVEKFNQFIKSKNQDNIPIVAKQGFQFYPISSNTFLGWNQKVAVMVITSYNSHRYYQPEVLIDTVAAYGSVGEMAPYADSSISLEKVEAASDSVAMAVVDTTISAIDSSVETTQSVVGDDAVAAADETEAERANREASEKFYREEALRKDSVQLANAENILQLTFTDAFASSVRNNGSFNKLIDPNADISFWMDSTGLLSKLGAFYAKPSMFNYNMMPGYSQAANLYFDKDKVRIEQQLYSASAETAKLFKEIYNSKQNPSFVNYLRPSDLGFMSLSVNTEALMVFYYDMAKKIIAGVPYIGKETEMIDAYVDVLEIMIDEKAIANMLPGNGMIVLHGLTPKKVKYIAYDYDENYNAKETTKTKTELSPDFSVLFETKNERIFNKLINLPVKFSKDSKYKYEKTGDFYTLTFDENNIIDRLYFKVKSGKCIITTSLQNVTVNGPSESIGLDAATKQSVINSNYSGRINFNNIITALSSEVTDKKGKKSMAYLQANVRDLKFESSIKNDLIKTTTVLNIAGKHKNSLEYFFNVIENLLKIDAGDKK